MSPDLFVTERLKVRHLMMSDLRNFIDLQSNPKVMQYVGSPAMSKDECEADLKKLIHLYTEPGNGFYVWGVYQNNEMIGTCAIIENEKGNEIGYRLREKYWKQKFGSELTHGLINYAFGVLKKESVWAEADVENTASVKLLDKFMNRTDKVWNEQDNCWDYKYVLTKEEHEKNRYSSRTRIL